MEKGSEENKNEYPQKGETALRLASLMYKKLNKKVASAFHNLKRKIVKEREFKHNKLQQFLPIDDYKPPAVPPVARLSGLIKNCSKPFEKQLTVSDVRDDQNRLSLNKFDVEKFLLPLVKEKESLSMGIPVTTYDSDGNEYPMKFKIWGSKMHVLTAGWKRFRNDHGLRPYQDFVSVWMFRHVETGKLCFVITSRRLEVSKPITRRMSSKIQWIMDCVCGLDCL